MQGLRGLLTVAAVALTLGGCAAATEQANNGVPAKSRSTLLVRNDNWSTVTIYLVRGTMRTRVGMVNSMGTSEFRIPEDFLIGSSDVTVAADPIGSNESYVSPRIQVFPGAQVTLTIGNHMRLSNFAVHPMQ